MNVANRLAGVWTGIENKTVAGGGQAFVPGDIARLGQDPAQDVQAIPGHRLERRPMLLGDDQNMHRGLGMDVLKSEDLVVLGHDTRRQLPGDDPAKDAIALHG